VSAGPNALAAPYDVVVDAVALSAPNRTVDQGFLVDRGAVSERALVL